MRVLRSLSREQRGSVAVLFGFLLIPLIGVVGLAVDSARAYAVQAQLQQSLDAAALAGGRVFHLPAATRDATIQAFFDRNMQESRFSAFVTGPLTIVADTVNGTLDVSASADMPTVLMRVLGFNTLTIGAETQITRKDTTLELALVLDVTGSMNNGCGGCTGSKLNTLKNAINGAGGMLDILFGGADSDPNLFIGVVPFSNIVNIGTSNAGFLVPTSLAGLDWNGALPGMGSWGGCVFERPMPQDIGDAPPFGTDRFYPFYAGPDGHHTTTAVMNSAFFKHVDRFPTGGFNILSGETFSYNYTQPPLQNANGGVWTHYWSDGATLYWSGWNGMMDGCLIPPVLPLESNRAPIQSMVGALTAGGSTMTTIGTAWGRRLISPNWRGYWSGVPATRPVDHLTDDNFKAIVLMTDGANFSSFWSGYGNDLECSGLLGGIPPQPCWGDGATGGSANAAVTAVNNRQTQICNDMKAEGIRIYTIVFGLSGAGTATQKAILSGCAAGSGGQFFDADTGGSLQTAFQAIASDLAALRVSQ